MRESKKTVHIQNFSPIQHEITEWRTERDTRDMLLTQSRGLKNTSLTGRRRLFLSRDECNIFKEIILTFPVTDNLRYLIKLKNTGTNAKKTRKTYFSKKYKQML